MTYLSWHIKLTIMLYETNATNLVLDSVSHIHPSGWTSSTLVHLGTNRSSAKNIQSQGVDYWERKLVASPDCSCMFLVSVPDCKAYLSSNKKQFL